MSCCSAGKPYVLGGQHLCSALQKINTEYNSAGKTVPLWAREVYADVLKLDTPMVIRKMISGDHNAQQHATSELRLSNVLGHYLQRSKETSKSGQDTLLEAVRIAGKMPSKADV